MNLRYDERMRAGPEEAELNVPLILNEAGDRARRDDASRQVGGQRCRGPVRRSSIRAAPGLEPGLYLFAEDPMAVA